ncbi:hypothetical protein Trydic_g23901 [Trypoxylus dichotomus]
MASYVNVFLLLNLGVEMVYVIAQRLNAQDVPLHRSALVLNQIVSTLVSKELISDVMKIPQPIYSREKFKNTISDIAQSSIMRLDPISMDKLWDLVTMVFKWQITVSTNLLKITQRHVSELENYTTSGEVLLQLRKVQTIVDNFGVLLNGDELLSLRNEIFEWLETSNVKVSLLLKMGLQNADGSFVVEKNRTPDKNDDIFENLGQNIYGLTQANDAVRLRQKRKTDNGNVSYNAVSNEVNLLVDQLLGGEPQQGSDGAKRTVLRLNIGNGGGDDDDYRNRNRPSIQYRRAESTAVTDHIRSVEEIQRFNCAEQKNNDLSNLLSGLNINATDNSADSDIKEDLLDLIIAESI